MATGSEPSTMRRLETNTNSSSATVTSGWSELDSDWSVDNDDFADHPVANVDATGSRRGGCLASATISFSTYSTLIFSQAAQ